jgi:hypothetical protein
MKARIRAVLPDGADGPVMEPHYDVSRVITLSDYMATDHGLLLFWQAGSGHRSHKAARARAARKGDGSRAPAFGEILRYHADTLVPHAPRRDVRLSLANVRQVRLKAEGEWAARRTHRAAVETLRARTPARPKGAHFSARRVATFAAPPVPRQKGKRGG